MQYAVFANKFMTSKLYPSSDKKGWSPENHWKYEIKKIKEIQGSLFPIAMVVWINIIVKWTEKCKQTRA